MDFGNLVIILIALYFIVKWAVKNGIKEAYTDIKSTIEENADEQVNSNLSNRRKGALLYNFGCRALGASLGSPRGTAPAGAFRRPTGRRVPSRVMRKLVCRLRPNEVSRQQRRPQKPPLNASYSCTSCCPTECRPHGAVWHRPTSAQSYHPGKFPPHGCGGESHG